MDKKKKEARAKLWPHSKTTPTGVSPVFSKTARFRRETTARLLSHFFLWGYREIILPSFEYYDSISPGLDPTLLTKLYLMQDRGTGQVIVLRPDATAQIARLTTQSFQDNLLPLRFCYSTSVFRDENHQSSFQRELQQTGLELLGDPTVVSDREILDICISGTDIFPFKDPILVVSHSGLQEAIFRSLCLDVNKLKEFRKSFFARNPQKGRSLLGSSISQNTFNCLESMIDRVFSLEEAQSVLSDLPAEHGSDLFVEKIKFLELLTSLQNISRRNAFQVDFALAPPGPYYTGMFFQMFDEISPISLASGGRYDRLGLAFGHELPAVGFTYHITHIEEAVRKQEDQQEESFLILACYRPEESHIVEVFSRRLRKQGIAVTTAPDPSSSSGLSLSSSEILEAHEDISGVIHFDSMKNQWILAGRKKYLKSVPSIEDLEEFILSDDIR